MFHKPAYCGGGHGEDEDIIAFTSAVLEKRGVAMVFAGHSHFYQHNFVNGIHHMVIGSAGAPLYDPTDETYTLKSVKDYNWAVCDVTPDMLTLQVFNDKGRLLDAVHVVKPKAEGLTK
jgi:predicted phosphodiesterase